MYNPIEKLTELFAKFPGIGPRQARRFVYYLLSKDTSVAAELGEIILQLKKEIRQCQSCFCYFPADANSIECEMCRDPQVDNSVLMVLEKNTDLENVKKSGVHHGRYFVLDGLVSMIEEKPNKHVRVRELISQVKKLAAKGLKEIIVAVSVSPQGDYTVNYLREALSPLLGEKIKISTLGRGLSSGSELEYSDPETLRNALKNRG